MQRVVIPKEVYEEATKKLRKEYERRFGKEEEGKEEVPFSREDLVDKYAKILQFWVFYTPRISPAMSQLQTAVHAICVSSRKQIASRTEELKIKDDVFERMLQL